MYCQRILILVLTVLSLIACGEATDTRPGQPVAHRRAAFKKLLLAFEPMGVELREKHYDSNQFIGQAKVFAGLKDTPWTYFGVDTNYPPTHAKANVWSDPDQFKADQQAFLQAVDRLLLVAEDRDEAHVVTAYEALQNSCRNCHKSFRE
jgi:cytochrome c556